MHRTSRPVHLTAGQIPLLPHKFDLNPLCLDSSLPRITIVTKYVKAQTNIDDI